MNDLGHVRVLFVAGLGPIVREAAASRSLYDETPGIRFKEESGGYFPHGGARRRENIRVVAAIASGAVLLRQGCCPTRFPCRRHG